MGVGEERFGGGVAQDRVQCSAVIGEDVLLGRVGLTRRPDGRDRLTGATTPTRVREKDSRYDHVRPAANFWNPSHFPSVTQVVGNQSLQTPVGP